MRTTCWLIIFMFLSLLSVVFVFFLSQADMTTVLFASTISSKSMGEHTSLSDNEEEQRQQRGTESGTQTKETLKATQNGRVNYSNKILISKKNENEERNRPQKEFAKRKNLIILSPGRGGSSFLGSFFSKSPHVMYWYEPLFTVQKRLAPKMKEPAEYKETCLKIIDAFLKCDFGNISDKTLSAYFRRMSFKHSNTISTMHLPQFSKTLLKKACNNYSHTVMKILTGRVPYKTIEAFKDLFQQQNQYDVKLVHLVRDPRAVINSRVKLRWMKGHLDPNFRENVHNRLCDPVLQNIRLGLFSPPPWLKNRFKVIRYEDLVANTVNVTTELYSFAGFDWSDSIDKWINILANNTKHRTAYSVYRNPSVALNNWKKAPEPFIRAVEDVCGSNLMDLLGYKKK